MTDPFLWGYGLFVEAVGIAVVIGLWCLLAATVGVGIVLAWHTVTDVWRDHTSRGRR